MMTEPMDETEVEEQAENQLAWQTMARAIELLRCLVNLEEGGEPPSVEGSLEFRVGLLHELNEAIAWAIGDEVLRGIERLGGDGHKLKAYRIGAKGLRASMRWAAEYARVAVAFPPEERFMGVQWNLYRACVEMADPVAALHYALENGLGADKLRALSKRKSAPRYRGRKTA